MIEIRRLEKVILAGLEEYLNTAEGSSETDALEEAGEKRRVCQMVRRNQKADAPDYPYISYGLLVAKKEKGGTYCEGGEKGEWVKPVTQTWSFTVQSNRAEESLGIALGAHEWFSNIGNLSLADVGVVVRRMGDVTGRDTLLGAEYEYRNGFDVVLEMVNRLPCLAKELAGEIEQVAWKEKTRIGGGLV